MKRFYAVVFTFILCSCATMFNSGNQSMQVVASDGEKHKVSIETPSGSYAAEIPTTITASPSTFKNVEVRIASSDCYNPTSLIIGSSITASYWANIFNFYGLLLDPLTGAMWKYNSISTLNISKNDCDKNKGFSAKVS